MKKLIVLIVLATVLLACGTSAKLATPVPVQQTTVEDVLLANGFIRLPSLEKSECDGITCRFYGEPKTETLAMLQEDGGLGFSIPFSSDPEDAGKILGTVLYSIYPEAVTDWIFDTMSNPEAWIDTGTQAIIGGYKLGMKVSSDEESLLIVIIPQDSTGATY